MLAIFKKEVAIYFLTPFGYIFIGLFLLLSGIVFVAYNLAGGKGDIFGMLGVLNFLSIIAFPILTMKLLAEEKKTSSDKLLFTASVKLSSIILGKYFAAMFVFLVTLASTGVFAIFIIIFGKTSIGAILGSYLGFVFLGAAFIAICLFASALTENQVTSAIAGFVFLLAFMLIGVLGNAVNNPTLKEIINWLSIMNKYNEFTRGIMRIGPLGYYLSFAVVFIYFTIRLVESRQWSREG